jgi:hypothetical protein
MRLIFLFILLFATHSFTGAQDTGNKIIPAGRTEKERKPLSATLSFFNHSISVPFHKMIGAPLHPGVQAGIEARYFETLKSKLFQTFNLGMFYNAYNGTGFYASTELAYRYTGKHRVFTEVLAGLGQLRMYHPADIYQLNSSGTYEKASDKGFSSPIISFAFGLGYSIRSNTEWSFAPFVRYGFFMQTRYSPDLDVLPHAAFHIGVRINKKRTR